MQNEDKRHGLPIEYRPRYAAGTPGSVPPRKASEEVARRLVHQIRSQRLSVGDGLPTESEMLDSHGVSRETLREGLRLLEVQGLITIKRGPGGGPVVNAVDAAHLAGAASLFFHVAGATYREAFDTWSILEPALVERLARSADRDELHEALGPFMAGPDLGVEEAEQYFHEATTFHAVLGSLAENRVLVLTAQAIEHVVASRVTSQVDVLAERPTIEHDHTRLAKAVMRGHANQARKLAVEHIHNIRDVYETVAPGRIDEVVVWS